MKCRVAVVLLLLSPMSARCSARSQPNPAASASAPLPGGVSITLVTFGPGSEIFERFGHDALWVHDDVTGTDTAYHWGLYDFNEPHFVARFVSGDTRYSMGAMDAWALIEAERRTGRFVWLQRLDLTAAQSAALRDFLRWNAQEANKYYRYDYFQDNCATRLRDALDRVLGGAIRRASDTILTVSSYRSESLRLTDGDRPAQLGIDLALGRPADRALTQWQSFFVPMRLRDAVRHITVPSPGRGIVPLVAQERALDPPLGDTPPVELAQPPVLWPRYAIAGLTLAVLVVGLRVMMLSRRGAAWGLAMFASFWWLVCGCTGVAIALAWVATRHVFWAWNQNLLLLTPLCLALAILSPAALLRRRAERASRATAAAVVFCGIIAALFALAPGGQQNGAIVALILPVHSALAWALSVRRPSRIVVVA